MWKFAILVCITTLNVKVLCFENYFLKNYQYREVWGAKYPRDLEDNFQTRPIEFVGFYDYHTENCATMSDCSNAIREIQRLHMSVYKWNDIAYNFLVCNNDIYEGRGWYELNEYSKKVEDEHLAVCIISSKRTLVPEKPIVDGIQELLRYGQLFGYLAKGCKAGRYSSIFLRNSHNITNFADRKSFIKLLEIRNSPF